MNSLTFPPIGIFIEQKLPHTKEAENLAILCLGIFEPNIGEPTLGSTAILNNPGSANDIPV